MAANDNPFSFKAFVNRRGKGSDEGDIPNIGKQKRTVGKSKGSKKSPSSAAQLSEDVLFPEALGYSPNLHTNLEKPEDNPFSFKKFVAKKQTVAKQPSRSPVLGIGLPTQSESFDSSSEEEEILPRLGKDKPSFLDPLTTSAQEPLVVAHLTKGEESSSSSCEDETDPVQGPPLPDLSKGLDVTEDGSSSDEDGSVGKAPTLAPFPAVVELLEDDQNKILLAQINKLKAENDLLRKRIEQSSEELAGEKRKTQSLREEIKLLKAKEEKDAKALEDMVQKVEQNLTRTTARAVTAEETIAKLTKEMGSLQVRLSQANPQVIHQQYEELLAGVREKTTYASQNLIAAAHKADLQIKELVMGVETLKNVAEVLMFIDRITELKHQ